MQTFSVSPIIRGIQYTLNLNYGPEVAASLPGWETARIRVQFRQGPGKPVLAEVDTNSDPASASLSAITSGQASGGMLLQINLSADQTSAITVNDVAFDVLLTIGGRDTYLPDRWKWPVTTSITVPHA